MATDSEILHPEPDDVAAALPMLSAPYSRRTMLRNAIGGVSAAALMAASPQAFAVAVAGGYAFNHGVASGDPLTDRVIIWTRVTPQVPGTVAVTWVVATDAAFQAVVAQGQVATDVTADYTVKVDVEGLSADTGYFYRFFAGGTSSPVGRTKTLPTGSVDDIRLAVFSCSDYSKGYFNAYRVVAFSGLEFDAVLHLGDYTYEYGPNEYVTTATAFGLTSEVAKRNAKLLPAHETLALADYRARLATYRSDPDLQACHARYPWITIWDDHEVANDGWTGGAENHNPGEGDWQTRKEAGIQAYYEWMPLREPASGDRIDPVTGNPAHLYRSFDFGDLARLIMLDTRYAGRNQQKTGASFLNLYQNVSPAGVFQNDVQDDGVTPRTLMGAAQETWFAQQIQGSVARQQPWQLIGNQILMHFQIAPDYLGSALLTAGQKQALSGVLDQLFGPGSGQSFGYLGSIGAPNPAVQDSWTGYPSAKNRMLATLFGAANPVVLSGDSHNFWAANLKVPTRAGKLPVAVEFGGSSVTSPGYEQTFPIIPGLYNLDPAKIADLIVESNHAKSPTDELVYAETTRRGFMLVLVRPKVVFVDYYLMSRVELPSLTLERKRFTVRAGTRTLQPG